MPRILVLCALLLGGLQTATAESLDLNVNNDAVRLTFSWNVRDDRLTFDAGWLHHQETGNVAHLGLHLVDFAASGPDAPEAGLGAKLFYIDGETLPSGAQGGALGLGGFLRYRFPQANRFGVRAQLYFAPDVVAFGDATNYLEASVGFSYDVVRDADVYVGFRYIKADFEGLPDLTVDTGLHVGLHLNF